MKTSAPTHPVLQDMLQDGTVVDSTVVDRTAVDSTVVDRTVVEPDHDSARSEAEALWAALGRARSTGVPRAVAAAEDAVFRFYLPLSHALAAGAARSWSSDPAGSVHAAELGLASAVLSWRGSESGFLRFASGAITDRLHRSAGVVLPVRGRPRRRRPVGAAGRRNTDDVVRRIH